MSEFALPDVGEGLTEAEIVAWRVGIGDSVNVNDVLDTVRYRGSVDTAQYQERSEFTVPGQVFYVGLTYKLGAAGAEK